MLTLAYTEALLAAFAAWALYALLRGRWGWAAGLAVLAGLTRPTGIAVAAAVTAAAAYEICRRRGRAPAAVWAAGLAAPAGWASYVLLVGVRRGIRSAATSPSRAAGARASTSARGRCAPRGTRCPVSGRWSWPRR